jgi:hypothetical protein
VTGAELTAQWRALLGDDVLAEIHDRVQATPELSPEDHLDDLRHILARPAGRPTSEAPAAADAA